MGFLRRANSYDRKEILAAAEKARAKGRRRRAIALYRRILVVEPHDCGLQARIAPLLAKSGHDFEAWQHYEQAAKSHIKNQQLGEALQLYREAAGALPHQVEAWRWIARIECRRGKAQRARDALLEGRHKMTKRRLRPQAISLLRAALELDPGSPDIVIDLARQLSLSDQTAEALVLLEKLANRSEAAQLRRVRAAQWLVVPSLRHTWYWIRDSWSARHAIGAAPRRVAAAGRNTNRG